MSNPAICRRAKDGRGPGVGGRQSDGFLRKGRTALHQCMLHCTFAENRSGSVSDLPGCNVCRPPDQCRSQFFPNGSPSSRSGEAGADFSFVLEVSVRFGFAGLCHWLDQRQLQGRRSLRPRQGPIRDSMRLRTSLLSISEPRPELADAQTVRKVHQARKSNLMEVSAFGE